MFLQLHWKHCTDTTWEWEILHHSDQARDVLWEISFPRIMSMKEAGEGYIYLSATKSNNLSAGHHSSQVFYKSLVVWCNTVVSSHLLRNWWELRVSSTVSAEAFHPNSTIFLHGHIRDISVTCPSYLWHIRDIFQLCWHCTLLGVCMCPPAPFSGETPPALVRWGGSHGKYGRAWHKLLGMKLKQWWQWCLAMIYAGQRFLYLHYR